MRDNLVFSGIPEQAEEDPELTIKNFIQTHLKLTGDAVKNIPFHRVHRLGGKRPDPRRPIAIVAKFEHYQQKVPVRGCGRELRGTDFSVNDQFPQKSWKDAGYCSPSRESSLVCFGIFSISHFHSFALFFYSVFLPHLLCFHLNT